jgi:Rps23 Pro-64 3,4-dihydroxylase Tpa1-like proline 4-hydroxylase
VWQIGPARKSPEKELLLDPGTVKLWATSTSLYLLVSIAITTCTVVSALSLLPEAAIRTIQNGGIAVIPNYLSPMTVSRLRKDASNLYTNGHFIIDSLAGYGKDAGNRDKTKFDSTKDRAVLPSYIPSKNISGPFVNLELGDAVARKQLTANIKSLRQELAISLNRPGLIVEPSILENEFAGMDGHEVSYTRFGPGAYLARHVDEHHEEVKGRAGWSRPTRRSLSWLVYLNEDDWDVEVDGGELCTHERQAITATTKDGVRILGGPVGSRDGDLQIGWLAAPSDSSSNSNNNDSRERPVFLDGRRGGISGRCSLYVDNIDNDNGVTRRKKLYLTKEFDSDPYLFITSDFFIRNLLITDHNLGQRFRYIEPPHGKLKEYLGNIGIGENNNPDEHVRKIAPLGGTLVVFDSVTLPHEVLPSRTRERWAASGWFHERQQPEPK